MIEISRVYGKGLKEIGFQININDEVYHIDRDQKKSPGIRHGAFPRIYKDGEMQINSFTDVAICKTVDGELCE